MFLELLGIGGVAHFLGTGVLCGDVGEAQGGDDFVADADFLADAIDEVELHVGEHDGEGDAGEAAAGAEVHDAGAGAEVDDLGDAQGVEDMVLIEVVDVLARDDIDLGVPVVVEGVEGCEALKLLGGEGGEVVGDETHGGIGQLDNLQFDDFGHMGICGAKVRLFCENSAVAVAKVMKNVIFYYKSSRDGLLFGEFSLNLQPQRLKKLLD